MNQDSDHPSLDELRQGLRRLLESLNEQQDSDPDRPEPPRPPAHPNHQPSRIEWSLPSYPPAQPAEKKAARVSEGKSAIDWGAKPGNQPDLENLVGVEDAFDHTPLQPGEKVAFCKRDRVAYHLATWDFLKDMNHGRCCICGQGNAIQFFTLPSLTAAVEAAVAPPVKKKPVQAPAKKPLGVLPNYTLSLHPDEEIISLEDIPNFIGRAVIVEGFVYDVYCTQKTGTYFVRFEARDYAKPVYSGFKLVIFPEYARSWNDEGIDLHSYRNCRIRARGLVRLHEQWGLEILLNTPRLIQVMERNARPDLDEVRDGSDELPF